MIDQLAALILDESKWLAVSLAAALVAVAVLLFRQSRSGRLDRPRVLAAMSLFFGVTIGTMAFGHLLAVTTKLCIGALEGSAGALEGSAGTLEGFAGTLKGSVFLYLIGIALAVPSWWLIYHACSLGSSGGDGGHTTLGLNAWLAATLLVLGVHNLPLALPGLLNIGYQVSSRRAVGLAIVATAVLVNLGLLIGSLVFLASGQSFEQFRGIP